MTAQQRQLAQELRDAERAALDDGAILDAQDMGIIRSIYSNVHALDSEMFTGGDSDLLGLLLYGER